MTRSILSLFSSACASVTATRGSGAGARGSTTCTLTRRDVTDVDARERLASLAVEDRNRVARRQPKHARQMLRFVVRQLEHSSHRGERRARRTDARVNSTGLGLDSDSPDSDSAACILPPVFFRGQTVGKYKILSPLGSGGFGTVYLAEDTWIDKKVAIKVPHRQNVDFGDLLREPRLLASLNHPNIVSILTAEKQENLFFIVMEYVPGDTLETVISRDGKHRSRARARLHLPDLQRASITRTSTASSIAICGPATCSSPKAGSLKVADFGTSRFIEIAAHGTTVIGSPPYMAPEQFHGKAVFASDIYSLGVTMYQMLTGVLPYNTPAPADLEKLMKGELVVAAAHAQSEDPAEDQRHRHEGGRARREARYQRASDLLNDLLAARGGRKTTRAIAAANAAGAAGCGVISGRCAGHPHPPARARDAAAPLLLALPQAAPRPICALPVLWRSAVDAKLFSRSARSWLSRGPARSG